MKHMRRLILIWVCAVALALTCAPKLFAATPSPSPRTSPSPSPRLLTSPTPDTTNDASADAEVQKNIKDRIQQVIDEKKDSAATRIKRALVGQVEKINAESITIKTLKGNETAKLLDGKTIMLMLPALQHMEPQDIELNSFVIALGYVDETGAIEVRRLLISPVPLFPTPKEMFVGTVQTVSTKDITVLTRENKEQKILLSKTTQYENKDGANTVRTSIKPENEVFVTVVPPVTASSSASLVRVLR